VPKGAYLSRGTPLSLGRRAVSLPQALAARPGSQIGSSGFFGGPTALGGGWCDSGGRVTHGDDYGSHPSGIRVLSRGVVSRLKT
jgi:hypothetical protein